MRRFKNLFVISLCILSVLTMPAWADSVFAGTSDIGVFINGTAIDFPDVKPFLSDDRTFVPIRFVSEQFGATVNWVSDTDEITVKNGGDIIKLTIGSKTVTRNGASSSIDAAPMLIGGRTMVPLRFVSEQLGAAVEWDDSSNSVQISTVKTDTVYTVKSGDTFWHISSIYGISIEQLTAANPDMNPEKLTVGQQINLPSGTALQETDPAEAAENPSISRGGERTISLNCTADELIAYAERFLGSPYAYGGASPAGFDCSGFVQYVVANFDGYLPHSSSGQYQYGAAIGRDDLKPGDLVFFSTSNDPTKIGHVGIYIGEGKFIHSPQANGSVEISNMTNVYFAQYYYGATRMHLKSESE